MHFNINIKNRCFYCSTKKELNCQKNVINNTIKFYSSLAFLLFGSIFSCITSSIVTGLYFQLPLLILFWIFYQCFVELIIHCPGCPFWDENEKKISCAINCGIPKPNFPWIKKYLKKKKKTYSGKDKIIMLLSNYISVILPLIYIFFGAIYFIFIKKGKFNSFEIAISALSLLLYILTLIPFSFVLFGQFCNKCINTDCPMNITFLKKG